MSFGEGLQQGIQAVNAMFAPIRENRQQKRGLEEQKALLQMKADFERQQKEQEYEQEVNRMKELAKQIGLDSGMNQKTPSLNNPQQVAINPSTGRQQFATPEALARSGQMSPLEIPAFAPSSTSAPNPLAYVGDTKGFAKAISEYQKQKAEEEQAKQALAGLPLSQQGELTPYVGNSKEFQKEYANLGKRKRQAESTKKLFGNTEALKGFTEEDWMNVDPTMINAYVKNKELQDDRQASQKERDAARFENQKLLKEMSFENSKALKSLGRAISSSGGGSGGNYGIGTFKDEYGDPVKYYLDKQGRPGKKYLEPYKENAPQTPSNARPFVYSPVVNIKR